MTTMLTTADWSTRLGVPRDRIRLDPPPGTATEEDVLEIEAHEDRLCELVEGVLVEKPMGYEESLLAGWILTFLNTFVGPRKLGRVTGEAGMMRLFPGLVRMPDVAFVSKERDAGRTRGKPIPSIVPDLAVEVLSKSNTKIEMERKREEYFRAGVRLVWMVDPKERTVAIYTSLDDPTILTENQRLDGGEVLPGFTMSLAELFSQLDPLS